MPIPDEHLPWQRQRAEVLHRFVGAIHDDCIRGREPWLEQSPRKFDPLPELLRQRRHERLGFRQSVPRELAEIVRPEQETADEALQGRMRRIPAHDVENHTRRHGVEQFVTDGLKPIQHSFMPQFDPDPIQELLRRGPPE